MRAKLAGVVTSQPWWPDLPRPVTTDFTNLTLALNTGGRSHRPDQVIFIISLILVNYRFWGTSMGRMLTGFLAVLVSTVHAEETVNSDDASRNDLLNIKIESASKQAEPWAEAPVPVSIITKDMIKLAGVRTVHEALTTFVPGYTNAQDRNESVFAPRGIYATSQQNVLIMVNGHRLNSGSYLASMPDYGIAIHNLERIEVLRGPGSSLYGNVALAGVVNLITKKGKDTKNSVEIGGGDNGQQKTRFLAGDGGDNWDILGWGQFYKATGEVHQLDGNEKYNTGKIGRMLIDGTNDPASHDVGMTYHKNNWTLFAASRQSGYIEPYGSGSSPYDYSAYRKYEGAGPGLSMEQQHLDAKYDKELGGGWDLEVNPYYDQSRIKGILAATTDDGTVIAWQDRDIGFITQANKNYANGNVLVGAQVDAMEATDSIMLAVTNGEFSAVSDSRAARLLSLGGEESYSLFVQNKHRLSERWILNAGARYDYKNRKSGDNYDNISPRVAVVYLPNDTWEHKLSYSQSFVDGPYWYRYNQGLATFGGSEALNPEILNAYQFQSVWKSNDQRLRNAATLYYQEGKDLVINRATALGTPADPKYVNSGSIESGGLENELSWMETKYQVFWNLQYAKALQSTEYSKFGDKFSHVPNITSNLILNYSFTKNVSANLTVKYIGPEVYNSGTFAAPASTGVDSATLFNLGARYEDIASTGIYFDARVYNVADTEYYQGGQSGTQIPFRQSGRWWFVTIGKQF